MLKVKICGITNLEDARYCAAAGADFLGFIQYPESPRYVAPEVAREIIEWIHGPEKVGVFVNATPDAVNRAIEEVASPWCSCTAPSRPNGAPRLMPR